MLSTVTLAAALVTTTTVAHAQPGLAPLAAPSAPVGESVGEPAELKSPTTATLLALAGAVLPVAVMVATSETGDDDLFSGALLASTLTPSLGHWYAGEFLTTGMALRGVGGLLVIAGVAQALSCFEGCSDGAGAAGGLILAGAGSYVGGTIYDVATAGAAARRYNRSHGAQMAVAPTMIPAGGGAMAMGMGVSGSF